jgi:hypothetical protein
MEPGQESKARCGSFWSRRLVADRSALRLVHRDGTLIFDDGTKVERVVVAIGRRLAVLPERLTRLCETAHTRSLPASRPRDLDRRQDRGGLEHRGTAIARRLSSIDGSRSSACPSGQGARPYVISPSISDECPRVAGVTRTTSRVFYAPRAQAAALSPDLVIVAELAATCSPASPPSGSSMQPCAGMDAGRRKTSQRRLPKRSSCSFVCSC